MEGDSRLGLLLQAAVSGAIDFSKAKFSDPGWWRRLNLVLRELLRQNNRVLAQERIRYHASLMGVANLDPDTYRRTQEKAIEAYEEIVDSYRRPFGQREQKIDTANKLIEAWEEEFGKQDDPETKAAVDAATASILNRSARSN